eukprot:2644002-Amphidinium_carterae.1
MEYCQGGSLADKVREQGALPEATPTSSVSDVAGLLVVRVANKRPLHYFILTFYHERRNPLHTKIQAVMQCCPMSLEWLAL